MFPRLNPSTDCSSMDNQLQVSTHHNKVPLRVLQPVSLNTGRCQRHSHKGVKPIKVSSKATQTAVNAKVALKKSPRRLTNQKRHLSGLKPRKKTFSLRNRRPIPTDSKARRQLNFALPFPTEDWNRVISNLAERLLPEEPKKPSIDSNMTSFSSATSGTVIVHGLRHDCNHNVTEKHHNIRRLLFQGNSST